VMCTAAEAGGGRCDLDERDVIEHRISTTHVYEWNPC
jgi:hypothetical protein